MLNPADIGFRRLTQSDLDLMHRWRNRDFVIEWYGKRPYSYEEIIKRYLPRIRGEVPTDSYLILYGSKPIGYIQTYRIADYPDYARHVQTDEGAAGLDLFIGEPDFIHKGLGSAIIGKFLNGFVFTKDWATSCVTGSDIGNKGAIRAYEKAGFRHIKTVMVPDEDGPEYLMRITRAGFIRAEHELEQ